MSWQERAACAGAESAQFFPEDGLRGQELVEAQQHHLQTAARRFCAGCPVIVECAALADEGRLLGLFGGSLRFRPSTSGGYNWELLVDAAPTPRPADRRTGVRVGWVA